MARRKQRTAARRVVAYVRVSSSSQAESGLGLEAQRERVLAYARLYDLEVVEVIEDAGESAKTLERPGIARALRHLAEGSADGLLIAKLDRLSRSLKDWAELIDGYFGDKARHPSTLMSVGDSIDTTSAAGRLVLNVLITVSQWEREAIGERTAAALAVKSTRGERVGGIPYGQRLAPDGVHLEEHPEEQATLSQIHALRASGEPLRAIAEQLNTQSTPARGARWHTTTICRILRRDA